jgi:hypothetical protein
LLERDAPTSSYSRLPTQLIGPKATKPTVDLYGAHICDYCGKPTLIGAAKVAAQKRIIASLWGLTDEVFRQTAAKGDAKVGRCAVAKCSPQREVRPTEIMQIIE